MKLQQGRKETKIIKVVITEHPKIIANIWVAENGFRVGVKTISYG